MTQTMVDYRSEQRGPTSGPGTFASRLITRFRQWRQRRRDLRDLQRLSDEMLWDVGLTRADVERLALEPAWDPIDYGDLDRQRRLNARRVVHPRGG